MYQSVNFSNFVDAFRAHDRQDQFSYEAKRELFDYFTQLEEDQGQEIELDVIAICCEFSEDMPDAIMTQYNIEPWADDEGGWLAVREYLENQGAFVGHSDNGIVYIQH
jgi:hypothetical protein